MAGILRKILFFVMVLPYGLRRMLHVDDVVAVEDAQDALEGSGNGLYIGTGKAIKPGTFWSGLIDEVRIYNRSVRP